MTETKNVKKRRYEEALDAYTQATKVLRKGECEKSEKLFSDFLNKYSSEIELADRARLYLKICAEKTNATTVTPKTFEDYLNYGIYLMNGGQFNDALKNLDKASKMEPKEAKISYLTSINHMLSGNKKDSLENLKNAVKKDGAFAVLAQNESDFEPIWEDEEFKAVTEG